MVTANGRIKILDFGLSKLNEPTPETKADTRTAAPRTVEGVVMGSRGYMSPEQASGDAVDARTDVFAVGVVIYEMAAGRRPFAGDTLRALLHDQPPPLLAVRADLPPALIWWSPGAWRRILRTVTHRAPSCCAIFA
jgi:serine/threonine-protein kinase